MYEINSHTTLVFHPGNHPETIYCGLFCRTALLEPSQEPPCVVAKLRLQLKCKKETAITRNTQTQRTKRTFLNLQAASSGFKSIGFRSSPCLSFCLSEMTQLGICAEWNTPRDKQRILFEKFSLNILLLHNLFHTSTCLVQKLRKNVYPCSSIENLPDISDSFGRDLLCANHATRPLWCRDC